MNNGEAIAAAALVAVLVAEGQELTAPPDKHPTAHGQPAPAIGPHLDYRLPSRDVTLGLTGLRTDLTAGTVQAVEEPSATVLPAVGG
jgi:hypothetical protein